MENVNSDESSNEEIELRIVEEDWDVETFDTDLCKRYSSDVSCLSTSYSESTTSQASSSNGRFMLNSESSDNKVCSNSELNEYKNGHISSFKSTENRHMSVENKQCLKIIEGNGPTTERHQVCDDCQKVSENTLVLQCSHCICLKCIERIACNGNKDHLHSHLVNMKSTSNLKFDNSRWQNEIRCINGIICPICKTETCKLEHATIPINDLQLNPSKSNNIPLCTSCVEEECSIAVSRCAQCDEYLCTMCVAFHKRQRKTRNHELSNLRNDEPLLNGFRDNVCLKHRFMQLRFYCEDCKILLCGVCCIDEHIMHDYEEISSDIEKYKDKLTSLMNDSISKEKELSSLITTLLEKEDRIKSDTDCTEKEVNLYFDGFIAAVEKHRHNLLNQIENVSKNKIEQIQGEVLKLTNILKQCSNVHIALKETVRTCLSKDIIDIHRKFTDKLNSVNKTIANTNIQHLIQNHTDSMVFCPEAEACVIDKFQMYGLILGTQVSPRRCYISGEGLQTARVGHRSTLTVHTRDENDLAYLPDVKIKSFLRGSGIQRYSPVSAHKNKDASYTLSFTPQEHGEHRLVVMIQDEAIEGSPFCFSVKPRRKEHSGNWHCCTFCSTRGRMDEICVHGSSKHGLRGCIHSNRSHPGGPHWSCCGKMTETSECLLLHSNRKPRSLSQRDINHGNSNVKRSIIREVTL